MIRAAIAMMVIASSAAAGVPDAYLGPEWRLIEWNGQPVAARVTIDLSQPGQVSGQAPCNRYAGRYDGTLPDFRPGPLRATRMACPDLPLESAYFTALGSVTQAAVSGDRMVLSGPEVQLGFIRQAD